MLNDKQTTIKITIPYGMVLHASGIPQEYTLIFAYSDVDKLTDFAASIVAEAARVKAAAEKFLKPVEQLGCQHPKERLKFTNEGVFCLDCNESILAPTKTIPQELPIQPTNVPPRISGVIPGGPLLVPTNVGGQTIHIPAPRNKPAEPPPQPTPHESQPVPPQPTDEKKE